LEHLVTVGEPAEILSCDACNGGLVLSAAGSAAQVDLMNGFAWCCTDLSDLWKVEVRGADRTLAGLSGERAYPREVHSVTMQFPMVIVGKYDKDGALNADAAAGLATTLRYLRTNLELPTGSGNGTRTATWTLEDGTTYTAPVHVIPPLQHAIGSGALCKAVLTISVPGGVFS
jgi:hypothetical protein